MQFDINFDLFAYVLVSEMTCAARTMTKATGKSRMNPLVSVRL